MDLVPQLETPLLFSFPPFDISTFRGSHGEVTALVKEMKVRYGEGVATAG